ncbi:unnamed protein product [Ectocarpus sp. 6 AP-2014]
MLTLCYKQTVTSAFICPEARQTKGSFPAHTYLLCATSPHMCVPVNNFCTITRSSDQQVPTTQTHKSAATVHERRPNLHARGGKTYPHRHRHNVQRCILYRAFLLLPPTQGAGKDSSSYLRLAFGRRRRADGVIFYLIPKW